MRVVQVCVCLQIHAVSIFSHSVVVHFSIHCCILAADDMSMLISFKASVFCYKVAVTSMLGFLIIVPNALL